MEARPSSTALQKPKGNAMRTTRLVSLVILLGLVTACAPEIGSDAWCADMKEKSKGDWTVTEAKGFAKHCLF
jgi:hypothetical protein